ncbi:hypothetical protein PISMIDRAFT_350383 [Pisolithus microcarpus 441]|uniref:Uncharacterized protein n=1 Tax=Pisolithus microcarpus 441 TaxID=765257 RepID=A0A0C9YWL5_9AGAM|nr:hypothetical protein BKA83DRAFT_350383 [Pisolithus microcarpus]KIK14522.1 hypothetical protein PISMIDRAFT_350383 [Pisolithus microcarpus 441]
MSAPPKSRKRKRSTHDNPVDLTKMQLARQRLSELQEELRGIEETEVEMAEIMEHVDALQGILGSTKKLKLSCSSVSRSQLTDMGLKRILFVLNDVALDARIAASSIDSKHIDALCLQLTRIHRSTSKRIEAGARMILDAVLLTVADISFDAKEKLHVAIFPQMRIASGDGVLVKNTVNQSEVWLTGNVDYGVFTCKNEANCARILESSLDDLMMYAGNRIMLVEAKRDKEMLIDGLPEATSLAIALSEVTGDNAVRYCLTDGTKWMFLTYTRDAEGNRISYEGPLLTIVQPPVGEGFKKDVRRLVELLCHWLRAGSDIKNDPLCTV